MEIREEFRPISGYHGRYSVSNYGAIMNNKTHRVLMVNYDSKLPSIGLSCDGIQTWIPVCVLVARAFVDNPNNYEHVRFIDGDNRHHRADNLEWVESEQEIAIWEK